MATLLTGNFPKPSSNTVFTGRPSVSGSVAKLIQKSVPKNPDYGSAPTNYKPYERFDFQTPGAALEASGKSFEDYARSALAVMNFKTPENPFPNLEGTPFLPTANDRTRIDAYTTSGGGGSSAPAQKFMRDLGLTAESSPGDLAAGLDAFERSQQQENQMPKNSRGFAGSVFADLLPVVIGALTGNPALGALFGTVAGAATGGASGALKGAFGGFGAGGGFDPITDKIKGFVSEAFGGGGFSNPTALGLEGSNLALPGLANAPAATPVAGYGAGALSTPGIAAGGALGLSPSLLYNPKALAAPTAASTPRTPNVTTLLGGPAPAVAPTGTTVNSSTGAAPRVTALGGGAPQRGVTEMGFGGVTRGARQAAGAGRTASNTLLGG